MLTDKVALLTCEGDAGVLAARYLAGHLPGLAEAHVELATESTKGAEQRNVHRSPLQPCGQSRRLDVTLINSSRKLDHCACPF